MECQANHTWKNSQWPDDCTITDSCEYIIYFRFSWWVLYMWYIVFFCSKIIIFLQSFNNYGEKLCFETTHTRMHFCYLITMWMIYIWWNYASYILCFDVLWEPSGWYFVIKTMFLLISNIVFLFFNDAMPPSNAPSDLYYLELHHALFFLSNSLLKAQTSTMWGANPIMLFSMIIPFLRLWTLILSAEHDDKRQLVFFFYKSRIGGSSIK